MSSCSTSLSSAAMKGSFRMSSTAYRCPVMIVDDDHAIRTVLTDLLEDEGYQVVSVGNGRAALDLLHRSDNPRLILLDLKMPVMSGAEFRQVQLQDPNLATIPIAVISAHDRGIEAEALEPVAFIPKPFNFDQLLATVERLCS